MTDPCRRRFITGALSAAASGLAAAGQAKAAEAPAAAAPQAAAEPSRPAPLLLEARRKAAGPAEPPLGYGDDAVPTLRVPCGATRSVRLINRLDEVTDIEWHGMRLPNALDLATDVEGAAVPPGATRDLVLTAPDAGTFWFHPRCVPGRADQTARGLAGAIVVEEPGAPSVDADQILLLTDRQGAGTALADRLAVNGKPWPETRTHAPGARLRLRLINGSTREAVSATFGGAQPFVIAIDGQPSELFRPLNDTLPVGPGARFDVLVDLAREPGAEFRLTLQGSRGPSATPQPPVFLARTDGASRPERPPIRSLTPNPTLPRYIPLEHSVRADLVAVSRLAGETGEPAAWTLNGADGRILGKAPLFTAKTGSPVTLALINRSAALTAFRVHGHAMRLLHSKDDGWEPYWRDSVLVPAGGTYHVAFRADNPGRWLIESPFVDQASRGLRGWFEVG